MKNLFFKAAMFLALPLMSLSFTSCSDDDDNAGNAGNDVPPTPPFKSELIGKYVPYSVVKSSSEVVQSGILINAVWKDKLDEKGQPISVDAKKKNAQGEEILDGEGNPVIVKVNEQDSPVFMIDPDGNGKQPIAWSLIDMMLPGMLNPIYMGGLESLTLKDNGCVAAEYHPTEEGSSIMEHKFLETIENFPGADMPENALTYSTDGTYMKVGISKEYLRLATKDTLPGIDIIAVIDSVLDMDTDHKLPFEKNDTHYFVPLKYKVNYKKTFLINSLFSGYCLQDREAELFVYVDRAMIEGCVPMIKQLVPMFAGQITDPMLKNMLLEVPAMLDELMNKSVELEIGICLKK